METQKEVLAVMDEALGLGGRALTFDADTHLLGSVPEFDSMAVVTLINALEERFDFFITDDEIEGETFATVGSLVQFVQGKLESS